MPSSQSSHGGRDGTNSTQGLLVRVVSVMTGWTEAGREDIERKITDVEHGQGANGAAVY